jgi:hypothetical protein
MGRHGPKVFRKLLWDTHGFKKFFDKILWDSCCVFWLKLYLLAYTTFFQQLDVIFSKTFGICRLKCESDFRERALTVEGNYLCQRKVSTKKHSNYLIESHRKTFKLVVSHSSFWKTFGPYRPIRRSGVHAPICYMMAYPLALSSTPTLWHHDHINIQDGLMCGNIVWWDVRFVSDLRLMISFWNLINRWNIFTL